MMLDAMSDGSDVKMFDVMVDLMLDVMDRM